jgi:hypothetical protein
MTYNRKLIEVALPLDAINAASAREIWAQRMPESVTRVERSAIELLVCRQAASIET